MGAAGAAAAVVATRVPEDAVEAGEEAGSSRMPAVTAEAVGARAVAPTPGSSAVAIATPGVASWALTGAS